jgi:hypothetical protein
VPGFSARAGKSCPIARRWLRSFAINFDKLYAYVAAGSIGLPATFSQNVFATARGRLCDRFAAQLIERNFLPNYFHFHRTRSAADG